jgi:hypothetical protein
VFDTAFLAGLPAWAVVLAVPILVVGWVLVRLLRRMADYAPQESVDRLAFWRLVFTHLRERRQDKLELKLMRQRLRALRAVIRALRRVWRCRRQ